MLSVRIFLIMKNMRYLPKSDEVAFQFLQILPKDSVEIQLKTMYDSYKLREGLYSNFKHK